MAHKLMICVGEFGGPKFASIFLLLMALTGLGAICGGRFAPMVVTELKFRDVQRHAGIRIMGEARKRAS